MNRAEYLSAGTARTTCKRGSDLPQAKLTESQVQEIRRLHEAKQKAIADLNNRYSAKALAAIYGVHHRTIERALQFNGWVHA